MTDESALLRAVLAFPDEDTPRLAYADWLDENDGRVACGRCEGKGVHYNPPFGAFRPDECRTCSGTGTVPDGRRERAEFIRVQCELANWPCECDTSEERVYHDECRCNERAVLRRRERELFEVHGAKWFGPTGCLTPPNERERRAGGEFRVVSRGFVSAVTLPLAALTEDVARELFGAQPVCRVTISDAEPYENVVRCHLWVHEASSLGLDYAPNRLALLPTALFKNLGGDVDIHNRGSWRTYKTRDLALAALSDAVCAWGRELAGLTSPVDTPA